MAAASQSSLLVGMNRQPWMAIRHPMKAKHLQDRFLIIVRSRPLPPRKFLLPNQLWIITRLRMRRANSLTEQVLHRPFASTLRFRLTAHRQQWNTDHFIEARRRRRRPVSYQPTLLRRTSTKQIQTTADILMPMTPRMAPISS